MMTPFISTFPPPPRILVGRRMAPGVLADGAVRGGAGMERLAGWEAKLGSPFDAPVLYAVHRLPARNSANSLLYIHRSYALISHLARISEDAV